MESFKVGDVVIGKNFLIDTYLNGTEGEITGGLWTGPTIDARGNYLGIQSTYQVKWTNGEECPISPHNLRKKQPPKRDIDKVTSWEDCLWKPNPNFVPNRERETA